MKKTLVIIAALLVCGVAANAEQDTTLADGYAEVRDPVRLKAWLEANASDAETRVAALEGGSTVGTVLPTYIIVGNASSQGVDVAVSGDIGITSEGLVSITDGVVVNADIATNAAIAASKLADADLGDVSIAAGAVTIDADAVDAANIGVVHQADTNAATVVTGYTPAFVCQVLIGGDGGTNAVWISKGVTTNDWVQLAP